MASRPANRPTETRYEAADVRSFIADALNTAPAAEQVQELLVRCIIGEELHPTVLRDTLVGIIGDIVGTATTEDWIAISTDLINDARDALIDDEPATACAR